MKRTLKRLLCLLLSTVMCVTMLPLNALAWSYMSHTNSANIIRMEMLSYGNESLNISIPYHSGNEYGYGATNTIIPDEFYSAIFNYPDAFRAGALGPDFYPDMLIGQMYIHPYDTSSRLSSGEWLDLLVESTNRMLKTSAARQEALAFTLGFMLHYCGDMFGHDFINTFSGGTFPSFLEVDPFDSSDPELNNILSHMSMESYMDDQVNDRFYKDTEQLAIAAPNRFVADTLLLDGNIPSGAAEIFENFGGSTFYIEKLLEFRGDVMGFADDLRELTEPICMFLSSYADQWALDIDAAIYGLVEAFDRIAHRLVTGEPNPEIEEETLKDWAQNGYPLKEMLKDRWDLQDTSGPVGVVLEELSFWLEKYGWKALGIPDWMVDPPIPDWLEDAWDAIMFPVDVVLARVKELLCSLFALIIDWVVGGVVEDAKEIIEKYDDRLDYPSKQLDHPDNPYKPDGIYNNAYEFYEYIDRYEAEQALLDDYDLVSLITNSDGEDVLKQLTDSEFEAFYNTMMMFKLILMGPESFTRMLESWGIDNKYAYQTNTAEIAATVLKVDVKTIDLQWSGTDDNVWLIVMRNGGEITRKLLDNSFDNDLECGDTNTFYVELPYAVKLNELSLYIEQHDTPTADGGWKCERITVTPMHAGAPVYVPIGLGGNLEMDAGVTWDLQFQSFLLHYTQGLTMHANMPVSHVAVRIKTGNGDYDSGTDQDVKFISWDTNNTSVLAMVDLDKYLYNDFEDGDDDVYIVPVSEFDKEAKKNKYPKLGSVQFWITQDSDYDWYLKNVTITPYFGNIPLTEPMDFGDAWIKESSDLVDVSPYKKINDGTVVYWTPPCMPLTYETALDDGLLASMDSLDAGVQWTEIPVFWDTKKGRRLFFNLFKGFEPDIELQYEDMITDEDTLNLKLLFSGKWNGVGETRRNALAEYARETLDQRTYEKMPAVTGRATVTIRDSATGQPYSTLTADVNGVAEIQMSNLDPGIYDIEVSYTSRYEDMPNYADTEVIYENALVVKEVEKYAVTVSAICDGVTETSKRPAALNVYGTVTGAGVYTSGTRFKVTATPNTGYKIKEWIINQIEDGIITNTETISGKNLTNNTFSGTSQAGIDADFVIVFEPETYSIGIETNDDLGLAGTVEGAGTYKYGERGRITATPNEGFVFTGWYLDGRLLSTKEALSFTAVKDAVFTAEFALAATVSMPGSTDGGYRIYVEPVNSGALDELLNNGHLSPADIRSIKYNSIQANKAGQSFDVEKDSEVSFTVEIKDGYEKADNFKVTIPVQEGRLTLNKALTPDENGKYTFTADKDTTVSIIGVQEIEITPKPVINYMEFDDGSMRFETYMEDDEEVELTLYVNGREVDTEGFPDCKEYTLSSDELQRNGGVFSVSATAKAPNKRISEPATLNDNSLGSDVVVPVIVEDSVHGTVEVEEKYNAPGVEAKLTVTPDDGYMLDKLTVTCNDGTEDIELEVTDEKIVESENGEGGVDIEVVTEEGVYYFTRPGSAVTVKAVFTENNVPNGDVDGDSDVDSDDVMYLYRHISQPDEYPVSGNTSDYDKDNDVDIDDALYLLRHTILPERYPIG